MGRHRTFPWFRRSRRPTFAASVAGLLLLAGSLSCMSCIGMCAGIFGGRDQRANVPASRPDDLSEILAEAAEETRAAEDAAPVTVDPLAVPSGLPADPEPAAPSEPTTALVPAPSPSAPAPADNDVEIVASEHEIPESITGMVTSIADGDTLTVLQGRRPFVIRLNGIDTPEKGQAFGTRAKDALGDLVFRKTVTVKIHGQDRYKRFVGDVLLDGKSINQQMVEDGFAWHYKAYSDDETLAAAETSAREGKVGLWIDPEAVPPWEYRANQRATSAARKAERGGTEAGVAPVKPAPVRTRSATAPVPVRAGAYWLNTSSGVRHNAGCRHYGTTKNGRACGPNDGRACGICGG